MPQFDLTTNVKEVPENFHKETTELMAKLLEKPSMVSARFGHLTQTCRQICQFFFNCVIVFCRAEGGR